VGWEAPKRATKVNTAFSSKNNREFGSTHQSVDFDDQEGDGVLQYGLPLPHVWYRLHQRSQLATIFQRFHVRFNVRITYCSILFYIKGIRPCKASPYPLISPLHGPCGSPPLNTTQSRRTDTSGFGCASASKSCFKS
jgi:hypothetical protein